MRDAQNIGSAIRSAIVGTISAVIQTYRGAVKMIWVAPIIFLIAVIPEFVQHVSEIKMGMFTSVEQAKLIAISPERWAFGYAKIAGLVIALLLTTRFLGLGQSMRRTIRPSPRGLGRTALFLVILLGTGFAFDWLGQQVEIPAIKLVLDVISWIGEFGMIILIVGAWVEDFEMTARKAFGLYLPTALVLGICFFAVMLPLQLIHGSNHKLAMGQPDWMVWALMIWDSLLVGIMATGMGSAIWNGYQSGATWRGWRPHL